MRFRNETAEIWTPDDLPADEALRRTTHMGIAAHHDDLEIMCLDGILAGFGSSSNWFAGVVVTDGSGSPRDGLYAQFTDEEMKRVRREEQKKAAMVGEYAAAVFLDYPSADLKENGSLLPLADLRSLLEVARPDVVYTHNLADKHPTHVCVAVRTIYSIRSLPYDQRPKKLYGCEVWRGLDWMPDEDKVVFGVDRHESIAAALVGVFDSQIAGGKRYDLATLGRRRANATYHQSHSVDSVSLIDFAMDLTPLIVDDALDLSTFVLRHVDGFRQAVSEAIERYERD